MVIGIFGENCVGKSTVAEYLAPRLNAEVYSGKDYLRMAKGEAAARTAFEEKLRAAVDGENVLYVMAEKDQLALLPEKAIRILVTADLETIRERFARRMHGNLPAPVAAMLERKHGSFDAEPHDIHIHSGRTEPEAVWAQVQALLNRA